MMSLDPEEVIRTWRWGHQNSEAIFTTHVYVLLIVDMQVLVDEWNICIQWQFYLGLKQSIITADFLKLSWVNHYWLRLIFSHSWIILISVEEGLWPKLMCIWPPCFSLYRGNIWSGVKPRLRKYIWTGKYPMLATSVYSAVICIVNSFWHVSDDVIMLVWKRWIGYICLVNCRMLSWIPIFFFLPRS